MDKLAFLGGVSCLAYSLYHFNDNKKLYAGLSTVGVVFVAVSVNSLMKDPDEKKQSLLTIIK